MLIDLETIKSHLRVDGDAEDAMIELYAEAAEQIASNYMGRNIVPSETSSDPDAVVLDGSIKAAILLIVGHLYANREAEVVGMQSSRLVYGAEYLLQPYRIGMGV